MRLQLRDSTGSENGLLLMRNKLFVALLLLPAATANGQDPYAVAPQAYQKQFENETVRVTRVHYAPNEAIGEHEHPARPTIFIYLNDGGPVRFKHQHGESGDYAATRPATRAGAYRLAAGRAETHVVENSSALTNDFLQVELKAPVDAKLFTGRRFRDPADAERTGSKVEFDVPPVRIVRINCHESSACGEIMVSFSGPGLLVTTKTGDTQWVVRNGFVPGRVYAPGEYLLIEIQ